MKKLILFAIIIAFVCVSVSARDYTAVIPDDLSQSTVDFSFQDYQIKEDLSSAQIGFWDGQKFYDSGDGDSYYDQKTSKDYYYTDFFPHVDLKYEKTDIGLKQEYILKEKPFETKQKGFVLITSDLNVPDNLGIWANGKYQKEDFETNGTLQFKDDVMTRIYFENAYATDAKGKTITLGYYIHFSSFFGFFPSKSISVVIPSDFLDTAVYPIIIDPSPVAGCTETADRITCANGVFVGNTIDTTKNITIESATIEGTDGSNGLIRLNSSQGWIHINASILNATQTADSNFQALVNLIQIINAPKGIIINKSTIEAIARGPTTGVGEYPTASWIEINNSNNINANLSIYNSNIYAKTNVCSGGATCTYGGSMRRIAHIKIASNDTLELIDNNNFYATGKQGSTKSEIYLQSKNIIQKYGQSNISIDYAPGVTDKGGSYIRMIGKFINISVNASTSYSTGFESTYEINPTYDTDVYSQPQTSGRYIARDSNISSDQATGGSLTYSYYRSGEVTFFNSSDNLNDDGTYRPLDYINITNDLGRIGVFYPSFIDRTLGNKYHFDYNNALDFGAVIFNETAQVSSTDESTVTRIYRNLSRYYDPANKLVSPDDGQFFNNLSGIVLNSSWIAEYKNPNNMTFYVWDNSGILVNQTTNKISGVSNSTTLNITVTTVGFFHWNACLNFGSNEIDCSYNGNRSFLSGIQVNNQTYNVSSYETDLQRFTLNITTDPSILASLVYLVYDNVSHFVPPPCSGECVFNVSFDIPLVKDPLYEENKSFYWSIKVYDGTSELVFNTTAVNQSVTRINLGDGGTDQNRSLNFTAYDEQNLTRIIPYDWFGTFYGWLGTGTVYRNFSISHAATNETDIFIEPYNRTMKVDGDIAYDEAFNGTFYEARNYFYRNASLKNDSTPVSLFLLKSSAATSFIEFVQDQANNPVNDSLIYTQRFYQSDGIFRTVQVGFTDNNGKTIGSFETEKPEYKFQIIKYGQLLLDTERRKVFPESIPYTLNFRVGAPYGSLYSPYENLSNLIYSLTANQTTKTVEYSYIDLSGTTHFGRLLVQGLNPSGTPTTICNSTVALPSAILTCNYTTFNGTVTAQAFISRSPEQQIALITVIEAIGRAIFSNVGLIMDLLILIVVGFATMFNPIVQIISINIALILLTVIGILSFGAVTLFAIMGVSTIVLIVLRL